MAKILKKILLFIPFLLIFFSIKNVYADESINIYFSTSYSRYSFSTLDENLQYSSIDFSSYNSNFIYNYNNSFNNSFPVVLYDKVNDVYILLFMNYSNSNCSTDLNISGKELTCFVNDNLSNANLANSWYAILSTKNESTYFSNTTSGNLTPNVVDNGVYYLTQNNKNKGWHDILQFIKNNSSNFELVYTLNGYKLYINGVEVPLKQNSSQPDEPDEPEEPVSPILPPYNFNNNKYYVPNYEKGNCVEILDKDTIRVFKDEFTDFYIDYYINSNYISKQGQVDLDYEKHCSNLQFTDIRYYGNDLPQILIILLCVLLFTIGFPYILYKRIRRR